MLAIIAHTTHLRAPTKLPGMKLQPASSQQIDNILQNMRDKQKMRAKANKDFWQAIIRKDMQGVEAAVKAGAFINYSEEDVLPSIEKKKSNTPLIIAVDFSLIDKKINPLLTFLLNAQNLDINKPNKFGDTALKYAIPSERLEQVKEIHFLIIKALIAHGADPDIKHKGSNAYDKAKSHPDLYNFIKTERAKYLKEQHEKTQKEVASSTALPKPVAGLVSEYLYEPIAQHPSTATGMRETKKQSATRTEQKTEVAEHVETKHTKAISEEEQVKLNAQLIASVEAGHQQDVQKLIISGAQVNARGDYRNTPLIIAASLGNKALVQTLLENKDIKIDLENAGGRTALIEAVIHNQPEIVELLLAQGANISLRDGDKLNAYDYAEKLSAIKTLIEQHQNRSSLRTQQM